MVTVDKIMLSMSGIGEIKPRTYATLKITNIQLHATH